MKNVVILGGGTAGWITALFMNKFYPNDSVTLVESEDIGILGAGEGTTPSFRNFLEAVNIEPSELVTHCKATVKLGINFVNWNGDGKSYVHPFNSDPSVSEYETFNGMVLSKQIADGMDLDELSLSAKLARINKTSFVQVDSPNTPGTGLKLDYLTSWAMHFDARLLAEYFRKVAVGRGVVRVEGIVKSFSVNEKNDITALNLESGQVVPCDFIFDCSGFARLILGKYYQDRWISYADKLTMNSAIPFFIDHDNDVKPETASIAMKYGWIWHIPVQGRYGCGYVFDNNYVSSDEALHEAEEYFGTKLTSPKTFKFNPGSFERTIVNNCMAVGLAQSFVEPLEATSIWISILNLNSFIQFDILSNQSEILKKKFNTACRERNDEVAEFLHLHYITKRNDSSFWRDFRKNYPMTESLKEVLDHVNNCPTIHVGKRLWANADYIPVAYGLELLDKNFNRHSISRTKLEDIERFRKGLLRNQQNILRTSILHKDFIKSHFS